MMPFVPPIRALEDAPVDPDHAMWVFRFQRGGEPREVHARRHDVDPHFIARRLADETGSTVLYTAAYITAAYHWQWTSTGGPGGLPMWLVVDPVGTKRARRVEACPNGCGGGRTEPVV